MSKIGQTFEKIVTVTTNFSELKNQVLRVEERIYEHAQRITRLEASRETLIKDAERFATKGDDKLEAKLTERLVRLEQANNHPILEGNHDPNNSNEY